MFDFYCFLLDRVREEYTFDVGVVTLMAAHHFAVGCFSCDCYSPYYHRNNPAPVTQWTL